jgi:hypothetical protein
MDKVARELVSIARELTAAPLSPASESRRTNFDNLRNGLLADFKRIERQLVFMGKKISNDGRVPASWEASKENLERSLQHLSSRRVREISGI